MVAALRIRDRLNRRLTLDRFDRPTAVNDPVNATDFTWTYRADGQPSAFAQPNGNTTIFTHDPVGRLVSKDTGSLALYDWTYNRAGQVLTELDAGNMRSITEAGA